LKTFAQSSAQVQLVFVLRTSLDDGAGCASNEPPFDFDFQKRSVAPDFKNPGKAPPLLFHFGLQRTNPRDANSHCASFPKDAFLRPLPLLRPIMDGLPTVAGVASE
jgi:hypothetical protein